jgi:YVTN family beta-propeller protein
MRRFLLAFALLAAGAAPAAAKGLAFVINSSSASISLIDVDTGKEVKRLPVLREPHHMALTPDHRYLLVGDSVANEVLFLNPETGAVERRMPVTDPYQLGFSPDGKWFVVNGLLRNQVDLYDAATMTLAARVPVSAMPSHMNFSPDSSVVFVTLQSTGSVAAIDLKNHAVLWQEKVGSTPAGILWHDGKLLVGVMGADYVAVLDPKDGHTIRRIQTGRGAHVLFVPHDGSVVYVTNRVAGTISVLDPRTLQVERTLKVPGGPDDMDFAPDGKMWIARRWAHSIEVLDPKTGESRIIPVERSPHGIWLNTHDHFPAQVSMNTK